MTIQPSAFGVGRLRDLGQAPPNNLPAQLTSLIGREHEVGSLRQLLQRSDVRLLTLTGPGGVGKTRLALHVAEALLWDFEGGVFLIDLTFITDPTRVVPGIAQALGLKEEGDQAPGGRLQEALAQQRLLLVLDNFEQVIEAGPQLKEVLEACPQVKVLVTSREALRVRGEHEIEVIPLALPDKAHIHNLEIVAQSAAVALFVKRAQAIQYGFALTAANVQAVAQVCARLDGLPLALELAATLLKTLTPQAMLTRLDHRLALLVSGMRDMPARHKTLRATIDWSYSLLTGDEKRLFRLVAGFAGGCTLAAVAACESPGAPSPGDAERRAPREGIQALIDKSLLRPVVAGGPEPAAAGTLRYLMLETIREYGLEQLAAHGESQEMRRRHATYYLQVAEQAEPDLAGPNQVALMDELDAEHDNLRAALTWARDRQDTAMALRFGVALWWFWRARGYLSEGRRWLDMALGLPADLTPDRDGATATEALEMKTLRARCLNAAGVLAAEQGAYRLATSLHQESLALSQELKRPAGVAASLNNLGLLARAQGDPARARHFYEQSLEARRSAPDKWSVTVSLNNLGVVNYEMGDYATARLLHEEGLALRREMGDKRGIAMGLNNLGNVLCRQGQYAEARALQEESLGLQREIGNKWGVAAALASLGEIDRQVVNVAAALENFQSSLRLRQELGDKEGLAEVLEEMAALFAGAQQPAEAAAILGAADALREALGAPIMPLYAETHEQTMRATRAQLGERRFLACWHEGRGMTPLAVVATQKLAAGRILSPAPAPGAPVLSAPDPEAPAASARGHAEFVTAVQEALRNRGRPALLGANPLLQGRLIARRAGAGGSRGKRVAALQALLTEACATLQQGPRDLKIYRAVYHTYIDPAPTQEQAAALLDLPFSTYRRHLKEGVTRVAEVLWDWETTD